MKRLYGIIFLIIVLVILADMPATGQQAEIDSISHLHDSEAFKTLNDSLQADACRRLSIEYVRISTQKAIEYAEEMYQISKRTGYLKDQAIALNLIGVCNASAGNLENALEYYLRSLSIRRQLGDSIMISNTLNNIGTMYVRLDNFEKGISAYQQALTIRMNKNDSSGIAQSLNNIGVANKMQGNYDTAMFYFEKSLIIKRQLNDKELIASSLSNLGELETLRGNNKKAFSYFEESLAFRKEINDRYGQAKTLSGMSDFMVNLKKYDAALRYLQKALNILNPGFADTNVFANPTNYTYDIDHNTIALLQGKAKIFRTLYQKNPENRLMLKSCFDTHAVIIDFIEQIRKGYEDEKSKLYLMNNYRSLYSDAITAAVDMFTVTKEAFYKARAFEFAEQGKARILFDLITENEARLTLKIPDSLIEKEKSLKKEIANLQKVVYEQEDTQKNIDSVNQTIFDKKRQLNEFDEFIEEKYPEYVNLKYNKSKPSLTDIQQILNDGQLFLQYHLTDTIMYIFIITNESNNIIEVALKPDFYEHLDKIKAFFTNGPREDFSRLNAEYSDAAYQLYQYLIMPFETYFHKKELIIIPDGQLFYIPFGVLISEAPGNEQAGYAGLSYLIKKYPVTYSYSASMYINSMTTPNHRVDRSLAAFALSFQKKLYTYSAANIKYVTNRGDELAELPGVKDEVSKILEMIPGEAFLDTMATEYRFKALAGTYLALHIATHGIIDNLQPMFSRLVFAADSLHNEDGDLYVWELYNMEMNAEMAVLSACNTGYGKLYTGEGIMTLARGFMYAGVPSLLISLWNVNDESTARIMTRYYYYLNEGKQKHIALQLAKTDYLASSDDILANPFFWGGFVHLGNTKSVSFGNPMKARLIIVGLILAGLIAVFLSFKIFRKIR